MSTAQRRVFVGVSLLAAVMVLAGFATRETSVIRTRSIVIVDDKGRERILIGAGPGVDINDASHFERTGYGLVSVDGKDRVVLGLDSKSGEEALTWMVREDGAAELSIRGADRRSIFLGVPGDAASGRKDAMAGLVLRKGDRDAHRLSTDNVEPPK